ncbi:MAG: sugar phosphate isomerase/epimerase, partial [Gemmatimonadetes bacterium]|nr:sugar phosphate isomerase/epimerase [Gemmatimonadota bacterium]
MSAIRQSVCFNPFNRDDITPEQLITAAANIGYKSVEMAPQEHWPLIKDHGLGIAIVIGHASLPDGLNKRENHDRIEDEILVNIDLAVDNGIPSLICFSGNAEGKSSEEGLANCVEGLRRVTAIAEEKGIILSMELLNSRVNHPDYQCDRTAWGVALCRAVGSPSVKLL